MSKWVKLLGMTVVVAIVVSAFALVVAAQGPNGTSEDVLGAFGWRNNGLAGESGVALEDGEGHQYGLDAERQGLAKSEGCDEDCADFMDADGDGVCDNEGSSLGTGRGGRMGQNNDGLGCDADCEDFVDADGDGVCDNAGQQVGGSELGQQSGPGARGGRMGRGNSGR